MKSPFNWVGNKYKYIDIINNLIKKDYDSVIDLFMGSGNILLNLNVQANKYIGNDIIPLMPNIYQTLSVHNYIYSLNDFNEICNKYDDFNHKDCYYRFREDWNKKYKENNIAKNFILETLLLLKMCSNSMVRFNKKGEFNQGFRGTSNPFFNEKTKINILNELNNLSNLLFTKDYTFLNYDCLDVLNKIKDRGNLIILDPPYFNSLGEEYGQDYTKEKDLQVLEYVFNTNNDFIYFNYLYDKELKYDELNEFMKFFNYIEINNISYSGQNRKGFKDVKEVLIYKL